MARIETDAPDGWEPPPPLKHAVRAASLALNEVIGLRSYGADDGLDGPNRESVLMAGEVLPSPINPAVTEEEWHARVAEAESLIAIVVRGGVIYDDLPASLVKIAHTSLRAATTQPKGATGDVILRIASAHQTAVHEAFMADSLSGRLRDALIEIRDALAEADRPAADAA